MLQIYGPSANFKGALLFLVTEYSRRRKKVSQRNLSNPHQILKYLSNPILDFKSMFTKMFHGICMDTLLCRVQFSSAVIFTEFSLTRVKIKMIYSTN